MKVQYNKEKKSYFVYDTNGDLLGPVTSNCNKILKWMESINLWNDSIDVPIKTMEPLINTGTYVYDLEDPDKKPYRWKIWDQKERDASYYEFINPKEAVYIFTIKSPWNWNEKVSSN